MYVSTICNNTKIILYTIRYNNLNNYMFRLYETTIIRLHVSEIYKKRNHTAVFIHSTVKTDGVDLTFT